MKVFTFGMLVIGFVVTQLLSVILALWWFHGLLTPGETIYEFAATVLRYLGPDGFLVAVSAWILGVAVVSHLARRRLHLAAPGVFAGEVVTAIGAVGMIISTLFKVR